MVFGWVGKGGFGLWSRDDTVFCVGRGMFSLPPPPPLEGFRRRPLGVLSIDKFGGYKTGVKERIEERLILARRNKVKEEEHLEIYGGLREDIGMKTYLHGPTDYAKELKLRFRVGDLDLP